MIEDVQTMRIDIGTRTAYVLQKTQFRVGFISTFKPMTQFHSVF